MTTQSQLVDELIVETLRPDMLVMISSFLTQTIRELHTDSKTQVAIGFAENLVEDEVIANSDERFVWSFPRPHLFQMMEAVYYPFSRKAATLRYPSSVHAFEAEINSEFYYYRTGSGIAFNGYGGNNARVQLAWFEYLRRLVYKAPTSRLVVWDEENQIFTYDPSLDTPTKIEAAFAAETNWMLMRHTETLKQGTRSKIYARLGQFDRAKLAYSLFESLRPGLVSAEQYQRSPIYNR